MKKQFIVLKNGMPQWWILCQGVNHLKRVLENSEKHEVFDVLVCTDEDYGKWESVVDYTDPNGRDLVWVDGEVIGELHK